jgi:hypothetical protein
MGGKTMKTMKISVVLLALLLAAMAIVPVVSADDAMKTQNAIRTVFPDISQKDFNWLLQQEIIGTSGTVPAFSDNESRDRWTNSLTKTARASDTEIKEYLYPNGPVIGYGINYLGCIEIYWLKNTEADQNKIEKINQILTRNGEKNGVPGTPIIIIRSDMVKGDVSRSDEYRPIIGGVQMTSPVSGGTAMATLGFSATTSGGTDGYVITSHLPTTVGQTIYQPGTGYPAGTVSIVSGNYADAAFVPYWNAEGTIVGTGGTLLPVKAYGDASANSQTIYMSGISSQSSGTVIATGVMIYHADLGRYLYNQHRASYSSANGDSGAPVYWINSNNQVAIGGIHWGHNSAGSYYSPISQVQYDLGVTPLLHY